MGFVKAWAGIPGGTKWSGASCSRFIFQGVFSKPLSPCVSNLSFLIQKQNGCRVNGLFWGVWFNGGWVELNCRQALLAADLCHPTVPFQVVLFCRCSCIFFR
jgi:hypothetical protein